MSSQSASSSNSYDIVKDGRVAVDGGGIGISSEGDVMVHMVADEAFMLGEAALETVRDTTDGVYSVAEDAIRGGRDMLDDSLDFARDISVDNRGLAEDFLDNSRQLADDAIYTAANLSSDFMHGSRDLAESTISEISGLAELVVDDSRDTLRDITGQFSNALATTQQQSKSESGQIAEQIVKIGLPVAALAFAVSQIWGK